jgi:hypothetical protein
VQRVSLIQIQGVNLVSDGLTLCGWNMRQIINMERILRHYGLTAVDFSCSQPPAAFEDALKAQKEKEERELLQELKNKYE